MATYYIQIHENNEKEKNKFLTRCMYEKRGNSRWLMVPNFYRMEIRMSIGQVVVETEKTMEEVIAIMDANNVRWAHISYPQKNEADIRYNQKIKSNETK